MKKISLAHRLRYHFDNLMSRGTIALILSLFIITALMLVIIAILAKLTADGQSIPF